MTSEAQHSNLVIYPKISVVVPTLNAELRLERLFNMLKAQTLQPSEIVVVDSSSNDNTAKLAADLGATVVTIKRREFNHGATRHRALLSTNGDYIAFLTDDAVPANKDYLKNLATALGDETVGMASGRQIPRSDARRFEALVRGFNYPDTSFVRSINDIERLGIRTFFASDACSIYRRTAYMQCGGFPTVETNEDMLMAAKMIQSGWKIAYEANAEVIHSHNLTPLEQYRRNKAVGRFLEERRSDLMNASELGEGMKLVHSVGKTLFEERRFMELASFGIDCIARLAGNRVGRREARKSLCGK